MPCDTCAELGDRKYAYRKGGRPEEDIDLPPAAAKLRPVGHYARECPDCGDLFRYDSSYEFLVGGSEEDETLTRLGPADAAAERAKILKR